MSLVHLASVCSHLQNATKARLGQTCVPSSKQILALMLGLQAQGFISSVTRGSIDGPDAEPTPTTQENVATRRLWLGLKYYDNEPVLSKLRMVSKPKQRIHLPASALEQIVIGKDAAYVKGLQPGECMFVTTDRGIFEAREAVERKIGGMALFRAS